MTSEFNKTEKFEGDKILLFDSSKEALSLCDFTIENLDEENGIIKAKTRISWWSWGEKVTVKVHDNGAVIASSKCVLLTQIIDWGKNKRNVNLFFSKLRI